LLSEGPKTEHRPETQKTTWGSIGLQTNLPRITINDSVSFQEQLEEESILTVVLKNTSKMHLQPKNI